MQDITAIKPLCQSFNGGEISNEDYKQRRREILDGLYSGPDAMSPRPEQASKAGKSVIGLIGSLLLIGAAFAGLLFIANP
jgi:hypothetical protein